MFADHLVCYSLADASMQTTKQPPIKSITTGIEAGSYSPPYTARSSAFMGRGASSHAIHSHHKYGDQGIPIHDVSVV